MVVEGRAVVVVAGVVAATGVFQLGVGLADEKGADADVEEQEDGSQALAGEREESLAHR